MPRPAGTCDQGNRRRAGRVGSNLLPRFQMKERPILFSGPMVRAILDGRKTQTRRVVKLRHDSCGDPIMPNDPRMPCPYGQPGDRLWVRETTCIAPKRWATPDDTCVKDYDGDLRYVSYKADGHSEDAMRDYKLKWTPSIHVPRWASRLTLEVTSVRVERLQDISAADAVAEGIPVAKGTGMIEGEDCYLMTTNSGYMRGRAGAIAAYENLWESINGPGSWNANAWVWVIEFKRS
jgi:hypothetical protein